MITREQTARSKLTGQPTDVTPDKRRAYDQHVLDHADKILTEAWETIERMYLTDPASAGRLYDLGQLLGAAVRRAHEKREFQTSYVHVQWGQT